MSTTVTSGADILARIKPTRGTAEANICLRPDLLDRWSDLDTELASLRAENAERASTMSTAKRSTKVEREKAEEIQAVEAEIEAATVTFKFEAVSRDAYNALLDAHPPRKGNQFDMMSGYNRAAVEDALVRASLIDPLFEDCSTKGCDHSECGSWQQFLEVCNPSEWAELRQATNEANGSVSSAPKSLLASQVLRNGGTDSK